MEQKAEGKTRFMFIAVPIILLTLAAIVILYAWRAEALGLKEVALLALGGLLSTLGLITGYYFSKQQ